jgi:hypothetical protein
MHYLQHMVRCSASSHSVSLLPDKNMMQCALKVSITSQVMRWLACQKSLPSALSDFLVTCCSQACSQLPGAFTIAYTVLSKFEPSCWHQPNVQRFFATQKTLSVLDIHRVMGLTSPSLRFHCNWLVFSFNTFNCVAVFKIAAVRKSGSCSSIHPSDRNFSVHA